MGGEGITLNWIDTHEIGDEIPNPREIEILPSAEYSFAVGLRSEKEDGWC